MKKNVKAGQVLPARMRQKLSSSGRVFYYYDTCAKPRKWIALGSDYLAALKRYADLEVEYGRWLEKEMVKAANFEYLARRYFLEVVPKKSARTQADNAAELEKLRAFFCDPVPAPLDEIRPVHVRQYLDWRLKSGAAVRANREVALFSHMFNKAREWGMTDKENPCRGISRNKEAGRDVYVDNATFWAVYEAADRHIKFVMLVAYLIGQRVSDCLKIRLGDIREGAIWVSQNKVKSKVRIKLEGVLAEVIEKILTERGNPPHDILFVNMGGKRHVGKPLTYPMLNGGMSRARKLAGVDKDKFQFRDLRAKAATDKDDKVGIEAAQALLGHRTSSMTADYIRHRMGKLVSPTVSEIERNID